MPLTAEQIAAEVRAELARQNKSHRDVAAWLAMPQSSATLRIQGRRPFRAEELATLADRLGVSPGQFFEGRGAAA